MRLTQSQRAEQANRREIINYLERIPELKRAGRAFEEAATDRFHSVVFATYVWCAEEGISSTSHPRAQEIYREIDAAYPSLPEIATKILNGEKIVFPKLYSD